MKQILFLSLLLMKISLFSQEQITNNQEYTTSISLSPLSFITLMADSEDADINDLWLAMSFNVATNNTEYDFGIAKYPNYLSLSVEKRNFINKDLFGFFYGPFISFDMLNLTVDSSTLPAFSTDNSIPGDKYSLIGFRFGGDIGYRINMNNIGLTPKIGLSIPLYYLYELNNYTAEELQQIYTFTYLLRIFSFGIKIDFIQ